MKNLEAPTSNWGMQAQELKEKFQLPEMAVVHPASSLPNTKTEKSNLKGKKYDQGKPRMDLLPPRALNEVAQVFGYGAGKYGDYNWMDGLKWSRLVAASLRHITAWISGEQNDPESGLNHLSHAACNILMLIECISLRLGDDDRWKRK